jgi:two-component system, cell cycle sensor histidine kinase and response regulator CckA
MGAGRKRQTDPGDAPVLLEDSPEPMLVVDAETLAFLEVNQAAIDKYGYSRDEFRNLRLTDIVPLEDRGHVTSAIQKDRLDGPGFVEIRHILANRQTVEVDMLLHRIRYGDRQAALIVPQDGTRRKQLEDQLRQAQKMEAVGMLAGGIAHDFNNLLTIINGYSQMLLGNLPENDENRTSVEQIMKAGERAAELTRQLLTFSRRQVVRPKVLDLNAIVAGTAVMLRRLIGEHIELRIVEGPDLGKVHADAGQLEQVILNLAVNSRDAMPRGGTLILETQNVELDEEYAGPRNTLKPGRYVMLAVTDSGIGMDAQTRSHLFEPFFTTKAQGKGTGLGLSTVYGIVKQSGGDIAVYSEPGHGTCVKIYFPAVSEVVTEEAAENGQSKALAGSETVLIVEDEEAVRKLLRRTLEKQGYRLLVAASGIEALDLLRHHEGPVHLLITDVIMPQMGGRQLAEELRAARQEIQVLYISGYTESSIVRSGGLGKDEAFLQKPFTPLALAQCVRELLDRADGASESSKTERCNT